ncbi:MAG: universal stress protein [Haloglomus sp.]
MTAGVYDSILVPVDGSDASGQAVEHASQLAQEHDARLHLVTVVEFPEARAVGAADSLSDQAVETMADQGETLVEQAAAGVPDELSVVTVVEEGTPSETITEHAASLDADLIVMGSHGRSGLERLALGSTTERVVRRADVPVLTVHPTD